MPGTFSLAKPNPCAVLKPKRMESTPMHQQMGNTDVSKVQHLSTEQTREIILRTLQTVREKKAASLEKSSGAIHPQENAKSLQSGGSSPGALAPLTPSPCEVPKPPGNPKVKKPVSSPGNSSRSPSSQSDDCTNTASSKTSKRPVKACFDTPAKCSLTPLDRILEEMDRTYSPVKRQSSAREPTLSRATLGRLVHHGETATMPVNGVHAAPTSTKPILKGIANVSCGSSWRMPPSSFPTSLHQRVRVPPVLCKLCKRRPASDSSMDQTCASCRIGRDVADEQRRLGVSLQQKHHKSAQNSLQGAHGKKQPKKLTAKKHEKRGGSTDTSSKESADSAHVTEKSRRKASKKRKERKRQCTLSSSSSDVGSSGCEGGVASKLQEDSSMPIIECSSRDKSHTDFFPLPCSSRPSGLQAVSKSGRAQDTALQTSPPCVSPKLIGQVAEGASRREAKDQCETEEQTSGLDVLSPHKRMRKEESSELSVHDSDTADCPSDYNSGPETVVIEDSACSEGEGGKVEETKEGIQSSRPLGETFAVKVADDLPRSERDHIDVDNASEETASLKSLGETLSAVEESKASLCLGAVVEKDVEEIRSPALSVETSADDSDVILVEERPAPIKQPLVVIDLDSSSEDSASSSDNVPAYPQRNVPAYPQRNVPAYPQRNVPAHPQRNVPAHPQRNVPAHPQRNVPAYPQRNVPAYPQRNVPFSLSIESGMLSVTLGNDHCDINKSLSLLHKVERESDATKCHLDDSVAQPVGDEESTRESLEVPPLVKCGEQSSNLEHYSGPPIGNRDGLANGVIHIVPDPFLSHSTQPPKVPVGAQSSPKVPTPDKLLAKLCESPLDSAGIRAADILMHQYVNYIEKFFDVLDGHDAETKAELMEALVPHGYLGLRNILDKIKEIAEATRCEDTVQVSSLELRIYTLFEPLQYSRLQKLCSPAVEPQLAAVVKEGNSESYMDCSPHAANGAVQSYTQNDKEEPAPEDSCVTAKQLEDILQGVFSNEILKSLPLEQLLCGNPAPQMPLAPPVKAGHDSCPMLQHRVQGNGRSDASSVQQHMSTGSRIEGPVPSCLGPVPALHVAQKQALPHSDISESSQRDCHRNVGSQTDSPRQILTARNTARPKVVIRPRKPSIEQDQNAAQDGPRPHLRQAETYSEVLRCCSESLQHPDWLSFCPNIPGSTSSFVPRSARPPQMASSAHCSGGMVQYSSTHSQCVKRDHTQLPSQHQGVSTGSAAAHCYQNGQKFPFGSSSFDQHMQRTGTGIQIQPTQHSAFQSRWQGEATPAEHVGVHASVPPTVTGVNQSYPYRPWNEIYPCYPYLPDGQQAQSSYGAHLLQAWRS